MNSDQPRSKRKRRNGPLRAAVHATEVARPRRFELLTFAFGRQDLSFLIACGWPWPFPARQAAPPVAKYRVVHSGFHDVADLRFEPPIVLRPQLRAN